MMKVRFPASRFNQLQWEIHEHNREVERKKAERTEARRAKKRHEDQAPLDVALRRLVKG
jgi:hypothetical protein